MPKLSPHFPLILGSGSPRRREIIAQLGVPFVCLPADADESTTPGESPHDYIERIVELKRHLVRQRAGSEGWTHDSALLVADTLVTIDDAILGKPEDRDHALVLLGLLNGRTHQVLTRYALEYGGALVTRTIASHVTFRQLTPDQLAAYVASGEGSDKAGSYALQGLGAALVRRVEGSVTGVIGLPAAEVSEDLAELGLWEALGGG